ncbi:hypothetical protein Tco_1313747 [Tanacetum coccineum]
MMAIFHDMIKETMEVFMDDFSVFGNSFSSCLSHLDKMLKRCEDINLVLNWEKCHFMVKEGIVLGHKISKSGIEVDRAKVDVIAKLPHLTSVKGVYLAVLFLFYQFGFSAFPISPRSSKQLSPPHPPPRVQSLFLGHVRFYRRFIQDFSKIARSMTHLLEKETSFIFSKECIEAFNILKKKLTRLKHPISSLPPLGPTICKSICDASDLRGAENLAADHLSRYENPHEGDLEREKECIRNIFLAKASSNDSFHGTVGENRSHTVVKKRITPDAITEGEWGFEHTKAVLLNEAIPFLNTLKEIFNVFDKDLDEITKVQTVSNQMEAAVQQCSDKSCNNQNALEIPKYFENNNFKAQLQAKDNTIRKLKDHIKSMRENDKEEKVKHDMDEIETINIELEHSVAKLLFENERLHKGIDHLKQIYKDQFDSIKRTRLSSKEHCDSLIDQLNSKSMDNADLKGMFKLDLDPLAPRLLKNKDAHINYLKYAQEQADILRSIVESSKTPDSNKPVLPSTGLKSSTSANRSQPTSNKKNDGISQTPSSNMKNKVEVQLRRANLSSNKKNHVKDPICDANVKHTMLNANSELICVKYKQCMFYANHDVCFLDFVNDVNVRSKSKSAKQSQQHNIWKPMGKVFTKIGYKWKPIGKMFTLVGNSCPLTKIISTKVLPIKETTSQSIETQNPEIQVYNRKAKQVKSVDVPSSSSLVNERFRNDQIAKILGYGDYQLGNVTISRLAKDGLARDIPKLKFKKDHICSAYALGKRKKSSHQPKAEDTNQEKLYLLHMDLCGPMCVKSINGKKYILVIVDD